MPQNGFEGRKKALKYLALTSTALIGLGQPSATAAEIWTGAASTNWFTAGNWNPAGVPTSSDDVTLDATFPNPTVINAPNAAAHYLYVGTIASYAGSLTITNGGTLSDTTGYLGYASNASGTVSVVGAGSVWSNSSDLFLALGTNSTGTLTISNGGAVSDTVGHVGYGQGTGTVTVDGLGSTWTNSGELYIAELGSGTLSIANGGAVSNATGTIGWHAGSNGIVMVNGSGSTWTNSSNLVVGDQGTATLTVSKGGAVSNDVGVIGALAGSTGLVFVDGAGSTWTNSSNLAVGDFGAGNLAITNGGAVSNHTAYVGNSAGSTGIVSVAGVGSTWTGADLYVGGLSTGTLSISSGGAASGDSAYIGYGAASIGTATITGAGSTWTNSGILIIGDFGSGTLNVLNGGAVSNVKGYVGESAGSTGIVTIDGAGSTWANSSDLAIGKFSTGTLTISNGGAVSDVDGSLASGKGSAGTATITGAGSTWTNSGGLFVGDFGSGVLNILNGGAVSNASTGIVGVQAASISVVTVDGAGSIWTDSSDLRIGNSGTGTLTISNDGAVSVGGVVDIAVLADSVGTLNIGAASGSPAAAAGSLNAASVQFGAGAGAINFNHTDSNYTFASPIGGIGTINQIAGTTNLTANSSGFTGATNVSGGLLAVNGSLANSLVTISGGTLGGNGTVGGIAAQSGGIIAPGNSIGTLNVAGDVDQAAGSVYLAELTSTGQSDLIQATGTATIAAGAVLDVVKADAAPYVVGAHYTVLQADNGVAGNYTLTGDIGTAFLGLADSYDANHVYLDVIQKTFAQVGLTPNQIATGGGADSLGAGNPLYDPILVLPTAAAAQDAFDQLSGEIHASAKGMLLEDSRFIRDAATNRIAAAFGDAGAAPLPVMAYGEGGPEMAAADTDRFAVWGQAFGAWGNTDSDGNAAAFDRSTGGLLVGADRLIGDWRVGLIGGYSHSSFHADARNSSGSSDNYHLGLYGGTNWGAIAFRTGAAYSWNGISTKRSVAFNGFADQLSANRDAGTAQVFGELAYKMDANRFHFEPFADLAYVSVHTDGFTEQGGAAALASAGSTTNATFTTLGLRASTDVALGRMSATARGMLGWRHAFGDVTPTSTFALAGGDAFTITGVPVARDSAVIEAGFDLQMSANATLGLSYVGQFGGHSTDNGAKANLNVRF